MDCVNSGVDVMSVVKVVMVLRWEVFMVGLVLESGWLMCWVEV